MTVFENLCRPWVREIIRQLRDPKSVWVVGECTIRNLSRAYVIWTGNGPLFLGLCEPHKKGFTVVEKICVWSAFKWASNREYMKIVTGRQG